ncbi:MAG: tetratricopeptide repeat protein, partial [Pseudomonadota bacterium]
VTRRDAPTLVVVDYASAKLEALASWLRALSSETGTHPPLRLLLLERVGGPGSSWWTRLFDQGGPDGEAVADLLSPGAPLAVEALSTAAERHHVFAAAYRAATDGAVPAMLEQLDRTLTEVSLGGEPLFIAMFALVAARQGLGKASALTADKIAQNLAKGELTRIGKIWAAQSGLPPGRDQGAARPFDSHLAALASLSEGWSEAEAHDAISREAEALNLALPGGSEPVRAALHTALPGSEGGIGAVLPDILGEAMAIIALQHLPERGVPAIRRAVEAKRVEVTKAIIRTCQDFLIRGEETPLTWLEALRAHASDLEALIALSDAMPNDTLELREIAAEVSQAILKLVASLQEGEAQSEIAAGTLSNLSNRLDALGRREEALAAIEEAMEIYRSLAAARPDAFLPDLAMSLNNLSGSLDALGHREEALSAINEAVTIYRRLAKARPDEFLPNLAMSLNNLSNRLIDVGRQEEALAASEEAVEIRRDLAAAQPDVFLPDLATSLNNLSIRLIDVGRREEALAVIEEAMEIYRSLTAARPDAFLPDLATSLHNLSGSLDALGRREDALAAIEEAVKIRRTLAAARPDAFLPNLAMSLNNLSNRLNALGRREEALAAIEEAVEFYRSLAAARPDAFADPLATSLWVHAKVLDGHGKGTEAVRSHEEAIQILTPLFLQYPQALAPKVAPMAQQYIERCQRLNQAPDEALLTPVSEILAKLQSDESA